MPSDINTTANTTKKKLQTYFEPLKLELSDQGLK